jgi:hypothetical protein
VGKLTLPSTGNSFCDKNEPMLSISDNFMIAKLMVYELVLASWQLENGLCNNASWAVSI